MNGLQMTVDDRHGTPTAHTDDVRAELTFLVPQETKPRFESAALTGGDSMPVRRTAGARQSLRKRKTPGLTQPPAGGDTPHLGLVRAPLSPSSSRAHAISFSTTVVHASN